MNNLILFFSFIILVSGCSFNKNSKFWTASEKISEDKFKDILVKDETWGQELNSSLMLKLDKTDFNNNLSVRNYFNNDGRLNYNGILKKSSRYKFSKIKNFYQFEPSISFNNKDIIFFDNKGSIVKFDNKSKLIWKKNYYSKSEKKLNPILQFANNKKYLIVADNIAKYYALDLNSGELIWSKNNLAPKSIKINFL